MSRQDLAPLQSRRLSLPIRLSLWLVVAAIIPLIVTIGISETQSRPALITQANAAMESDAKTRVQLIETYFNERLLDALTLGQVSSVQTFLAAMPAPTPAYRDLALHATYALGAGHFRDKNYTNWSLFDTKGALRLYYPDKPQQHGQFFIPRENMQMVLSGKSFISAVYYSPTTKKASVDIYSPIADSITHTPLGLIRATLNLDYIWNIVSQDLGNNGSGSYAFILDENGIRIASTDRAQLFTAVTSLSADVQQVISSEDRFGSTTGIPVLQDSTLASRLSNKSSSTTFQMQPASKSDTFQVVEHADTIVPWTYYVLSPMNTVTAVANNQLYFTGSLALVIFALAALGGLIIGQRVSNPILSSVENLHNNSQSLTSLATEYYSEAAQFAAQQLSELGNDLAKTWTYTDEETAKQKLERIIAAAHYIEQAAEYQLSSTKKLSTALKVTTQVTEQLALGATSATDTATQMEQVVKRLRYVVGK